MEARLGREEGRALSRDLRVRRQSKMKPREVRPQVVKSSLPRTRTSRTGTLIANVAVDVTTGRPGVRSVAGTTSFLVSSAVMTTGSTSAELKSRVARVPGTLVRQPWSRPLLANLGSSMAG
jgi:hypothetical protein